MAELILSGRSAKVSERNFSKVPAAQTSASFSDAYVNTEIPLETHLSTN